MGNKQNNNFCKLGVFFKAVILTLSTIPLSCMATGTVISHIIGGEEAEVNAQPYLVSIGLDSFGHVCGGTIIRPNAILSSASK